MVNGKSLLCSAGGIEDQASRASDIHCDIHSFPGVRIRKETGIGPGSVKRNVLETVPRLKVMFFCPHARGC